MIEPGRSDRDNGVDFEGLDDIERSMGISVVSMRASDLSDYFYKRFAEEFGKPCDYDENKALGTFKRLKNKRGDNAGRIVKWAFFDKNGLFYDKRTRGFVPVSPSKFQAYNDEQVDQFEKEVEEFRTSRLLEMIEGKDPKIKDDSSKFMSISSLR